jgi:hypothetical protein
MNMGGVSRGAAAGAVLLVCATAAACHGGQRRVSASEALPYAPMATIKDLMQSIVDPSAAAVWLSVTTVLSDKGTVETMPKTDEDWARVRHGAVALTEASNLLMMPGRHVARPGEKSEAPGVELEPSEMEVLIAKDRAGWIERAQALHEAGVEVLQAVDARDPQRIFELGEHIERACENCHTHYWYPNEKIPPVPTSAP